MLDTNLCQSALVRADLTRAQLVRSNFYEADSWGAITETASFEGDETETPMSSVRLQLPHSVI